MFHVNLQGCFILPSDPAAPAPPVHHSGVFVGSGIPHLPGRFVWLATFGEPCVALEKKGNLHKWITLPFQYSEPVVDVLTVQIYII